jgi:hypothetical protein
MYISTSETAGLGQPRAGKPYQSPFSKGGEYVAAKDANKLLTVLTGPSPYRNYILHVWKAQGPRLPSDFLRIISSPSQAPEHLRARFTRTEGKMVGGTIDRAAGKLYLLEAPGVRDHTRLEFALHEAVHLVASPFMSIVSDAAFLPQHGRSCRKGETDVGTFQRKFCTGFGEGATQVITEEIMAEQGIEKYYRERPYDKFTPPVRKMIEIFSLDKFARAYFWGEVTPLTEAMESRWGGAWRNVANYTSVQRPDLALNEITKLEAYYKIYKTSRKKQSPAGDFPLPRRSTKVA